MVLMPRKSALSAHGPSTQPSIRCVSPSCWRKRRTAATRLAMRLPVRCGSGTRSVRKVAGIGAVGGFLGQPTDQGIGGFEHRRPHQDFQLGHAVAAQLLGFKAGNQLLDFFLLREEDGGRDGFFFFAPAMFRRVSWMTNSAYCSVSCR